MLDAATQSRMCTHCKRGIREILTLIGPLRDWLDLASFRFTNPHALTKALHLKAVARRTGASTLVEIGTFMGDTALRCAPAFERVYTVELDPKLARKATERLSGRANVKVIEGDGSKLLDSLFANLNLRDVLVFLDGHYSGGATACGEVPEPAVQELQILTPHAQRIAGIVIDDFRLFGNPQYPEHPSKAELLHQAEAFLTHGFRVYVHLDQLVIARSHP